MQRLIGYRKGFVALFTVTQSNLIKLMKLQVQQTHELKTWPHDKHCVSPDIVNEQLLLLGSNILNKILEVIKLSIWFAVMTNKACDIANNENW